MTNLKNVVKVINREKASQYWKIRRLLSLNVYLFSIWSVFFTRHHVSYLMHCKTNTKKSFPYTMKSIILSFRPRSKSNASNRRMASYLFWGFLSTYISGILGKNSVFPFIQPYSTSTYSNITFHNHTRYFCRQNHRNLFFFHWIGRLKFLTDVLLSVWSFDLFYFCCLSKQMFLKHVLAQIVFPFVQKQ